MQTLALPFGTAGLDRQSGVMAVRPGALRDVRNVFLRAGKAEVRRGMAVTAALPDQGGVPCTDVVLLEPMRFERASVAVGYYAATRELHLYRLTGSGDTPTHVGLLFTLDADAVSPPMLHAAEVGGKLFLAHDEPLQSRRAATNVYDPLGATALSPLTAALNAAGDAPIRFRGVLAWSNYLVGWGFASATDNRPEIIRVSLPGQPTEFDLEHYFIAGVRGEPVLSCRPAGDVLLACKASQTFRIIGHSQLDFGILPLHSLVGALSHRLTLDLEGRCYLWSAGGPMALTGAIEPGRLEDPLDLHGPQPEGFTDLDYESGYCQYLPGRRALEWVFGSQSFLFDLVSGAWSYGESAFARRAGALLYAGASLADDLDSAPAGFPANVAATARATEADVSWDNSGAEDNETAEVWVQPSGGAWEMAAQVAVTEEESQETTVGDLTVAQEYAVAVRYRRGGRVTAGYESSDPSEWPATSRATFTTTIEAPTLDSLDWERTSASSERIRVRFTPSDPGVQHQVLRDHTVVATLQAGVALYDDTSIAGETSSYYQIRAVIGEYESALSNGVSCWAGPSPGPSAAFYSQPSGYLTDTYLLEWTNGDATLETQVLHGGAEKLIADPGVTSEDVTGVADPTGLSVRHRVESYGIYDYSEEANAVEKPA